MPTIERFFANLSGTQRLLAFFLIVSLVVTLIALLVGGWLTGVIVGILVLAILWISRPLLKPSSPSSNTSVRIKSLVVISTVALAVAGATPEAKPFLGGILMRFGISSRPAEHLLPLSLPLSALILAFVLIGLFIVNWFTRDNSAMKKHPRPVDLDFPEQGYRERLKNFARILQTRLNTLDTETKWDDAFFTPLDAEVEIVSGRQSRKSVMDLMTALRADLGSRILLVLGDPGAGKSIALRQLSKRLLGEVERTARVPVYVNLKEWSVGRPWTESNPPTAEEFRAFLLRALKGYNVYADTFLDEYFERMVNNGRFFFLLDSFDEIPGVLDAGEASWLIQHLSAMIAGFVAAQTEGRCIVASRFYRRPKFSRTESGTLEIRPFSDLRIHEALLKSGKLREETIQNLFCQPPRTHPRRPQSVLRRPHSHFC